MSRTVLALATSIVLLLGACSSSDSDSAGEGGGDAVAVGDSDLGQVLVTDTGLTPYVFTTDVPGTSSCVDACADAWPPYQPDELTGPVASSLGYIDRPDGSNQVAFDGQPLYTFAGDSEPGDTSGHNSGGVWFAVGEDGQPRS